MVEHLVVEYCTVLYLIVAYPRSLQMVGAPCDLAKSAPMPAAEEIISVVPELGEPGGSAGNEATSSSPSELWPKLLL